MIDIITVRRSNILLADDFIGGLILSIVEEAGTRYGFHALVRDDKLWYEIPRAKLAEMLCLTLFRVDSAISRLEEMGYLEKAVFHGRYSDAPTVHLTLTKEFALDIDEIRL